MCFHLLLMSEHVVPLGVWESGVAVGVVLAVPTVAWRLAGDGVDGWPWGLLVAVRLARGTSDGSAYPKSLSIVCRGGGRAWVARCCAERMVLWYLGGPLCLGGMLGRWCVLNLAMPVCR